MSSGESRLCREKFPLIEPEEIMKIHHPREKHRNIQSPELRCMTTRHGHLQAKRDLSA